MKTGPQAIDLIVPVYKNAELTARCLRSIAAHAHELSEWDIRLLVINDSPDDIEVIGMLEAFAAEHAFARILANPANMGFVHTANQGLAMARDARRDAILINSDTETYSGTLRELVAVAYADPQIAFVSPRSNNASLCSLPHIGITQGALIKAEAHERWRRMSRMLPAYHLTPTAVGFYLYIKSEVLANIGLLDAGFGVGYEEENDLIMRASKVGYRAALANHAFALHVSSASFKLTKLDLEPHRQRNLEVMQQRHPEFLPMVRAYERSAHFRAEGLLGRCIAAGGKLSLVFDFSSMGCDFNGTNEFSVKVVTSLCKRHHAAFDFAVLCTRAAFKFHGLSGLPNLRRLDAHEIPAERFAIAARLAQPFDTDAITRLAELASVNVYVMHDTIALDCGYLAIERPIEDLWSQIARHASGFCYISQFSQRTFEARFSDAKRVPAYTRLSSTRLADYGKPAPAVAEHVLVLGNHYAHKASEATAAVLAAAFPDVRFVVLGRETRVQGNIICHRPGLLSDEEVQQLYTCARMVVLPSYLEGFGLGLLHALGAGKVVVARDIPPTREILATYGSVAGVFLYRDETELLDITRTAMQASGSEVDDSAAPGWDDWADGFADFCRSLATADDLFARTVERLRMADLMRRTASGSSKDQPVRGPVICRNLNELLELDGEQFVHAAYWTVFNRSPDTQGLENYMTELEAGIDKLTIIARLRHSTEGQRKNLPLAGFRRAHFALRIRSAAGGAKSRS